jgi:undecaprenyl phosphate-alpha-L-ara4N flippase subunit ArnE
MTLSLVVWFAISVICDVSGQLCFKHGANRSIEVEKPSLWRGLLADPWTLAGIGIYTIELFVWLRILSMAPLSLAYPLASLNFLGVVIASRIFLKEPVSKRRLLGSLFITIGVGIVAATG